VQTHLTPALIPTSSSLQKTEPNESVDVSSRIVFHQTEIQRIGFVGRGPKFDLAVAWHMSDFMYNSCRI
jgi:hypothetical protein